MRAKTKRGCPSQTMASAEVPSGVAFPGYQAIDFSFHSICIMNKLMGKMCCLLLLTWRRQDSMFAPSVTIRCSRLCQSSSTRRPGRHFSGRLGRIHFQRDRNHPTPIRYSLSTPRQTKIHPMDGSSLSCRKFPIRGGGCLHHHPRPLVN